MTRELWWKLMYQWQVGTVQRYLLKTVLGLFDISCAAVLGLLAYAAFNPSHNDAILPFFVVAFVAAAASLLFAFVYHVMLGGDVKSPIATRVICSLSVVAFTVGLAVELI